MNDLDIAAIIILSSKTIIGNGTISPGKKHNRFVNNTNPDIHFTFMILAFFIAPITHNDQLK